jgi:hypothetical protein
MPRMPFMDPAKQAARKTKRTARRAAIKTKVTAKIAEIKARPRPTRPTA